MSLDDQSVTSASSFRRAAQGAWQTVKSAAKRARKKKNKSSKNPTSSNPTVTPGTVTGTNPGAPDLRNVTAGSTDESPPDRLTAGSNQGEGTPTGSTQVSTPSTGVADHSSASSGTRRPPSPPAKAMAHRYAYLDHLPAFKNDEPDPFIVTTVLKIRGVPERDHHTISAELSAMVPKSEDDHYITFALEHERAIGHTGHLPYVNLLCRPLGSTNHYLHIRHIVVAHLIVEVFELLYKKVGHPLPHEWIEDICKLLYPHDPHPPYDFGHLISVESVSVCTFRWARVYVDEEPQAIACHSPDSSQTCIVALAPHLLS